MPCAPLPEYSTKCAAIRDNALRAAVSDEGGITPLLTCFLPALRADEPFQISVHNWLAQPSFGYERTIGNGSSKQVWQVRIDIDGTCIAVERYVAGVVWPQIISCATQNLGLFPIHGLVPLRFPPFYHSVTQTNVWDPADETGRIMVELSEGCVDYVDGHEHFTKLKNYALFNFQPAPVEVLQRAGIAWPNPAMFEHPLPPRPVSLRQQYNLGMIPGEMAGDHNDLAHQRNMSLASTASSHLSSPFFSSSAAMPGPPPPTPATSMTYGLGSGSVCDESSRSTSAYSTIPYSSLPMPHDQLGPMVSIHAPSGAVRTILNTVNVSNANRTLFPNIPTGFQEDSSMPPPPLPQHVLDAKLDGNPDRRAVTCPDLHLISQQEQLASKRRIESRSNESDVSMHASCTSYPNCTSEDANGHILHCPPAAVPGRNEGDTVSKTDDRDYMSIVLSPLVEEASGNNAAPPDSKEPPKLSTSSPANSSGKKRTRAATRALLNVNGNGSPEKTEKAVETTQPASKLRKRVIAGPDH